MFSQKAAERKNEAKIKRPVARLAVEEPENHKVGLHDQMAPHASKRVEDKHTQHAARVAIWAARGLKTCYSCLRPVRVLRFCRALDSALPPAARRLSPEFYLAHTLALALSATEE